MKPRHLVAAILLPFAMVAAACSDDSDSSSADGADTEASTSEGSSSEAAATPAADAEATGTAASDTGEGAGGTMTRESDTAGDPMGSPVADGDEANIATLAAGNPELTTVTRLVILASLLSTLRDGGPFTVFAPANAAFEAIDPATLSAVRADRAGLAELLTLHVVPGEYDSEGLAIADGTALTTVNGGKLLVEVEGDEITVGGSKVVIPDVEASNGVVHVIDSVILEPNA
jgi:uncharacterized surface protein with fasciclin (FAS1) repeats